MVIIGVLSAEALPKLFNYASYQQRTLFDDTLNAVRYAEKLAVATSCNVMFQISNNQFTLLRPGATDRSKCSSTTAGDFTQAVYRPGAGVAAYQGSASGISMTTATVFFSAKGYASAASTIDVGGQAINIVQATGFAYAP
jgi:MSHA pilin protein MshC